MIQTRVKTSYLKSVLILQLYRAGVSPAGGEGEGAGGGGGAAAEWIPVELEILTKLWLPDTEILRLKGFHRLSVLDRLQVSEASEGEFRGRSPPQTSNLAEPA